MTISSGVLVNWRNLADFGAVLERIDGLPGRITQRLPSTSVADALGSVVTAFHPMGEPRVVTFHLYVEQLFDYGGALHQYDLLRQLEDLVQWCAHGTVELATAHYGTRQYGNRYYVGRFAGADLPIGNPQQTFLDTWARGSISFELSTPFLLEMHPRTFFIRTTGESGRVGVYLGSGPSYPVIQIMGPATNPTLTLQDGFGATLGTMTFTITLGADDFLGIDCLTRKVSKSVAGVISAADSTLGTGQEFFKLLPRYGSNRFYNRPAFLSLSSGTAIVRVRRTWKL